MMRCNFLIGNSSSSINEAPLLNCPSITIGSRQAGRIQDTQSPLIITSEFTRESIESSIKKLYHCHLIKTVIRIGFSIKLNNADS